MNIAKKIFFLVGLWLCCQSCYAGQNAIAGFSAILSRPSPGGGTGAVWAASSSGLTGFLFNTSPVFTGFATPYCCPSVKYRVILVNKNLKPNKSFINKALKMENQANVILYEVELDNNFNIKNPHLVLNSYNPKIDKNGSYSGEFVITRFLEF